MNQEPRRYTRADYRRAVRRRRIKARVGIVSAAAAVLLLIPREVVLRRFRREQ